MIVHNGQTADPTNKFSKAMKEISGKRAKTDADYEEMARIEFMAGLYMGPTGPIIPAPNIDSMILAAAKKTRQGKTAQAGAFCLSDVVLNYEGPRTAEELWQDGRFRFTAIVRVQQARIARTRPCFPVWSAKVAINFEDSELNRKDLDAWLKVAGTTIGLGDWRPQNGRFNVTAL